MAFLTDYDVFEVGETWTLLNDEEFFVGIDTIRKFKKNTDVEILEVKKESGYGKAKISMEGYEFNIGLDELYDMVFE